jgi:hypothetical protein
MQQQLDPNSLDNRYRQAQIDDLNRPSGGRDVLPPSLKDFTAKSVAIFKETGDSSKLKRYVAPRSAIKVDEGDAWGFYHPVSSQLIKRVPKQLGPSQTPEHAGAVATARTTSTNEANLDPDTGLAAVETAQTYAGADADLVLSSQNKIGVMLVENQKLDKIITLAESGANTGPLMSVLPSLTAATIALEQTQKEMGLDVVGSVTFGALSKGELDLAMQKALPTKLDEPDLIQWAKDKQSANRKLMGYMLEQIQFIKAGGTVAQWLGMVNKKGGINKASDDASTTDDFSAMTPEQLQAIIDE